MLLYMQGEFKSESEASCRGGSLMVLAAAAGSTASCEVQLGSTVGLFLRRYLMCSSSMPGLSM